MSEEAGRREAKALLDALAARPRPAGREAEAAARARCAALLAEAGFTVREEPFEYSALVGCWATPVAGALSGLTLAAAGHAGFRMHAPRAALAALSLGAALLGIVAWWGSTRGVLGAPTMRRKGVNLVATRGEAPTMWLAAHLDSKRQPVSILVRVAGITLTLIAWFAAIAVAVAALAHPDASRWWPLVSGVGVLGALPVVLSVVRDGSPGALDNASGCAAAVLAARAADGAHSLGVLLTSAEELGLAGAAAWARSRVGGPRLSFLNCDGIDDGGRTTVFYTGRAPRPLLDALERGADAARTPVHVRRLVPGILADSVVLSRAGHAAVTVSRGGYGTLSRIHRAADRADVMDGRGIATVVRLLAAAVAATEEGTDGR